MRQFKIGHGIFQIVLLQSKLAPKGKSLNVSGVHRNRTVELAQCTSLLFGSMRNLTSCEKIGQIGVLHARSNRLRDLIASNGVITLFVIRYR